MAEPDKNDGDSAPPPDAFFAGVPRTRVVVLGILLMLAGSVLLVLSPSLVGDGAHSQRVLIYFIVAGVAIVGTGIVFLVRKPSEGSPQGSARYVQLIEKQRAISYAAFLISTGASAIVLGVLAISLTLFIMLGDTTWSVPALVVGLICAAGSVVAVVAQRAARRGRLTHVKPPDA